MEVIYTGLHRTPEEVVTAALQEDVDVVGVSCLSGAHMTLVPRVLDLMKLAGADDIPLVVGGVFPDDDVPVMKQLGVADVVGQDSPPTEVVNVIASVARLRQPSPQR
jgi:methylmalonyl-CoA mutase C-terminal domain/subunit